MARRRLTDESIRLFRREMLGHEPQELYQALEIKRSRRNRDALPTEAQEALYTGDIAARHAIVKTRLRAMTA